MKSEEVTRSESRILNQDMNQARSRFGLADTVAVRPISDLTYTVRVDSDPVVCMGRLCKFV